MISSGISDVAITSVYSEKTRLKKFIMNKSQKATEIDFRYETKASKVMVDFKFDALYS